MTKKVVIIDDSSTSLNFIKTAFEKRIWDVYICTCVKDALELIYNIVPDLIITDAIMPQMGGFQFIKIMRADEKINEIPVIVYSVLPESNAKYYVKENLGEYFLTKKDNCDELLDLADKVTEIHKLTTEYKMNIKLSKAIKETPEDTNYSTVVNDTKEDIINISEIEKELEEKYDFNIDDESVLKNIFPLLYKFLKYQLCTVWIDCYEKNEKYLYCDINNIILNPILQNNLKKKYHANNIVLIKKYSPNLKTIFDENEFLSKLEFNFEYKNENTARIAFYSLEEGKWQNKEDNNILEEILSKFFKARYINKKVAATKKDSFVDKYIKNKFSFNFDNKSEKNAEDMYVCAIDIVNYEELKSKLSFEDLDFINSKISEKILSFIDKNEQIFRSDEDGYSAVIYAKDEKQAKFRLNCIINAFHEIPIENQSIEVHAGASKCMINGSNNIYQAQKNAQDALNKTTMQEKVIIE